MFRHERPQAGRLRQFHQFGVEAFGCAEPAADVEVIALLWRFFSTLGLPDLTLEINSLGEAGDRPAYKAVLIEFLKKREEKLCQNCRRRMATNPLRVLDCKVPECRAATEGAPKLTDHLSVHARSHFDAVLAGLTTLAIPFSLNPRLVRGLDYYTLTTFEVTTTHLGAQNAVGAGGRYDGLVETLGGPKTPAVGFAVGLERTVLALPGTALPAPPKLVYVASFGSRGGPAGRQVLYDLRALGIQADTDHRASTLKAHMKQADRLGASLTVIIGDDEAAKNVGLVRDMVSKEQVEFSLASIAKSLEPRLKSA
jgi:histidyl-tRNA synthetase